MPQINFNDPYINTELLPSFSGSLEKIQKMIDKLNGYFQEAMILFQFERQKLFREKRELVNLKAHRVFILCVMCHDKTMEISSANEGAEIDLNIRPTGEKKLLCKNYFIENYNT